MREFSALLREGVAALGLDINPAQETALTDFLALLSKWNRVYNLTAVRDPADMLTHHVLDSLAALPSVRQHLDRLSEPAVLDVGSGGGLPGVAWAIAQPGWAVTCVDAVAKKVSFIRQCAAELHLPQLQAIHTRVEALPTRPWPLITSRAFASLADFVQLTRHALSRQGVWVAMKGREPTEEMAALPSDIDVFHVEPLVVPGLNAERCLVWMRVKA